MIRFVCPTCRSNLSVPEEMVGKTGKCPMCKTVSRVPPQGLSQPSPTLSVGCDLYINDSSENDLNAFVSKSRTYCEKCKRPYSGIGDPCPLCSRRGGLGHTCIYCHTIYGGNGKNCPVCKVGINLDKAQATVDSAKAAAYWELAHKEAKANGYHFSIYEHHRHARYLAEAGSGDEAQRILNHLIIYCGKRLSSTKGELRDKAKYYSDLSHIEQGIAERWQAEERKHREEHRQQNLSLAIAYAIHAILSLLYYRTGVALDRQLAPESVPSILPETFDKINFDRMKRVLIDIKKNKQGRPETLCGIIEKHLAALPNFDVPSLEQDVGAVFLTF